MQYESTTTIESQVMEGVTFRIVRMSFGRRIDLTRKIRELGQQIEFLDAGESLQEKVESALLSKEVEKLYLHWGLEELNGLEIDGQAATPESLIASGPEELCNEIVAAIKGECGLSEEERKN